MKSDYASDKATTILAMLEYGATFPRKQEAIEAPIHKLMGQLLRDIEGEDVIWKEKFEQAKNMYLETLDRAVRAEYLNSLLKNCGNCKWNFEGDICDRRTVCDRWEMATHKR